MTFDIPIIRYYMITIDGIYTLQKEYYNEQETKILEFRILALDKLYKWIKQNETFISVALKLDLNKSEVESFSTEIGMVLSEITFLKKNLKKWIRPQKVKTALSHFGSKGYTISEPYGSVLIIAPWNYPFQLAISPLVGAIAAGNCAVVKPSELTPHTAELIKKMITDLFDPKYIAVFLGDKNVSQELLKIPFDYIFFTGSTKVGKEVMKAAANHLIPVTLELGGKSPCIIYKTSKLKLSAKRIAWGKFLNAGQTCVAPDYLYIHQDIKEEFLGYLKEVIAELYGSQPISNPNFTRIVNKSHFDRLCNYLNDGKIIYGGDLDEEQLLISPTIIDEVNWNSNVMQDEIFGPILPIMSFQDIEEVINKIQENPTPLALYLFSEDFTTQRRIVDEIDFGGGAINDTIFHLATPYLPFGGKGSSGIGSYHGKKSFDTFSHQKSLLIQTLKFDIPIRYSNFKNGLKWLKKFLK